MDQSLKLEHQICFQLYTASKELTRLYRPILAPLNLTYSQYLVMLVLWEEDGIDLRQLGSRLTLDSGTLSPLVKRLIQIGYVEKSRATDDERKIVVRLTEDGSALGVAGCSLTDEGETRFGVVGSLFVAGFTSFTAMAAGAGCATVAASCRQCASSSASTSSTLLPS